MGTVMSYLDSAFWMLRASAYLAGRSLLARASRRGARAAGAHELRPEERREHQARQRQQKGRVPQHQERLPLVPVLAYD